MTRKLNPFAELLSQNESLAAPRRASDDPGRDHDRISSEADEHTRSLGVNPRSETRRASNAPLGDEVDPLVPGEILYGEGDVVINDGLKVTTLRVTNTSDRPIQIGSHFHFAEVNVALDFDRDAAWGKRLAVLSGGAERFEPGAVLEVELVPIRGRRIVPGLRGLCGGELDRAKD